MELRFGAHPLLDNVFTLLSVLADGKFNFLCVVVFSLILFTRRRAREASLLFCGYCLGSLLSPLLKNVFGTARPPIPDQLRSFAFPSGHTLTTTILIGLLFVMARRQYPKHAWYYGTLGMGWIIAVALSRVYLGAHWPVDVIGGFILGAGFVALWTWAVSPRLAA